MASPALRVDRTIAQLLSAKRDLWDRRDSSTPVAMVDLLRRIYKAELIKPASRNYLLDLMAQCQTGKNRMKALLPSGTPVEHKTGTLDGLSDDVGFITLPDGRRVAVAIFTRGGSNRPAPSPKPRAPSTTASSRSSPGRSARRSQPNSASAHRCAREDRPLSGGRSGRALPQAHRVADQGHRASRQRRQRAAAAGQQRDRRARRARTVACLVRTCEKLESWRDQGKREARFLIGAADGHSEEQRHAADLLLSFGSATWPHLLVRAMLAEQLFRATSILANHPYHREG